jgi:hypothetical protein
VATKPTTEAKLVSISSAYPGLESQNMQRVLLSEFAVETALEALESATRLLQITLCELRPIRTKSADAKAS